MALQRFACCFSLMIILLCRDCHSQQQPACGRVVKTNRIIGGEDAAPGSWPWQAVLTVSGFFRCGGSLISDQWVLTAAQCITTEETNSTSVYLGLQASSGPNPNVLIHTLSEVICHPHYNSSTFQNDICLLRLSTPVIFTAYIHPVCLASGNSTFNNGTSSWVTGFGIDSNFTFPNTLQELNVPVVGNNECQCYNDDLGLVTVTDNMICTGFKAGGKGPCIGDGGGPLMINDNSVWIQSGIVSFSVGCVLPLRPFVYTRVSKYQEWISSTITNTNSEPDFVTFTSPGTDNDLNFNCSAFVRPTTVPPTVLNTVPPTAPSNVLNTVPPTAPSNVLNTVPPTVPPTVLNTVPPTVPPNPTDCDSVFCSGGNLMHLTHFTSLFVLVALLNVFVGSGGM